MQKTGASRNRGHRGLIVVLALLLYGGYYGIWLPENFSHPTPYLVERDFVVYYVAGLAVRSGEELYLQRQESERPVWWKPFGYFYPPAFATAIAPLTHLRFRNALLVWRLLLEAALALGIACLVFLTRRRWDTFSFLSWHALALALPLSWWSLWLGQMDALLLLLLAGAILAAARGRHVVAGSLLGAAAVCKLHPLLLLGYFVLRRRWGAVAAGCAVFVAGNAVALWAVGWEPHRVYLHEVLPLVGRGTVKPDNVSLFAVMAQFMIAGGWLLRSDPAPIWLVWLHAGMGLAMAALVLARWRGAAQHSAEQAALALGLGILGILLASRLCWAMYLLLGLIPGVLLWEWAHRIARDPAHLRRGMALLYYLLFVGSAFVTRSKGIPWASVPPLVAAAGLFAVTWWAVGRLGSAPQYRPLTTEFAQTD